MAAKVLRRTVDLSAYPDLVVIYLGMRVNAARITPGVRYGAASHGGGDDG